MLLASFLPPSLPSVYLVSLPALFSHWFMSRGSFPYCVTSQHLFGSTILIEPSLLLLFKISFNRLLVLVLVILSMFN
jgi:hypothetical protein